MKAHRPSKRIRTTKQEIAHNLNHPPDKPLNGVVSPLIALLWRTTVIGPEMNDSVFATSRESLLLTCFQELVKNQYYSCPVVTHEKQFFNFIDLMDIIRFTVSHFSYGGSLAEPQNFWIMVQKHKDFAALTVDSLLKSPNTMTNWSGIPIPCTYSLLHVAEMMARERNIHRLAVVDDLDHRNLRAIVTQSQLVRFIWENVLLLGDLIKRPVQDFPELFHQIYTVNYRTRTLDVFHLMSEKNVTGLPVVDDNDQLVGAISIKDIKGMAADGCLFWRLFQPLNVYMEIVRSESDMESFPVVYCQKTDKFSSVIDRLVFNKVHRVPVVESDKNKKVVGIITLRDVLYISLFR